jgi:hypothetical protein
MFVSEQPPGQDASAGDVAALLGGPGAKGGGVGWWWHTTEDTPDKLDPEFLARDARIYAAVAYRFLSETILPLDARASTEELLDHLRNWSEKAKERFDLSSVVARAEEVAELADGFQRRLEAVREDDRTELAQKLNEALRRVELGLVRLNYARSDPFDHDPAVPQPPVPLLAPIDRLLLTDRGSDEEREITTVLVRRRNRVMHELAQVGMTLRRGSDI